MRYFTSYLKKVILLRNSRCNALPPTLTMTTMIRNDLKIFWTIKYMYAFDRRCHRYLLVNPEYDVDFTQLLVIRFSVELNAISAFWMDSF